MYFSFNSLWELLLKDFSQSKQESSASEHKSAVDFGSHDTLIEQGLSSRRHNDHDKKPTNATYWMNVRLRHLFRICECCISLLGTVLI